MKYMDFQIVFNILKIKKILQTDWPNTCLPTTWELDFADIMFLAESQRQLWWWSFNTQKSTHWWIKVLYKTHIADLLRSTFGQAWLNQQFFSEILAICYFRALYACQTCLITSKKNFSVKLKLPWISFYMQKANLLPQKVVKILKFKKSCNVIGRQHFQLQLKNQIFHSHVVFIDFQKWCII